MEKQWTEKVTRKVGKMETMVQILKDYTWTVIVTDEGESGNMEDYSWSFLTITSGTYELKKDNIKCIATKCTVNGIETDQQTGIPKTFDTSLKFETINFLQPNVYSGALKWNAIKHKH
jgi:hypothetical protein